MSALDFLDLEAIVDNEEEEDEFDEEQFGKFNAIIIPTLYTSV